MIKMEGFVRIEARDTLTGELKDYREVHNLVFDAWRMRYFFPWSNTYTPRLSFGSCRVYLSEYAGPITQSSYNAITYYAVTASNASRTATYPQDRKEVLLTFATKSFAGVSPTRNLRCVGLYDATTSPYAYYTAVAVSPSITHDSATTLFVHYVMRLYLSDDDPLFGYETLLRTNSSFSYFNFEGGAYPKYDYGPHHVALPGYKKHFYISLMHRKALESADRPASSYLFKGSDDDTYYAKKGSISVPQWWVGALGGVYEMLNSGLCGAAMYDPHVSRVFAHKSSASTKIFYDSSEADVPESEGTLNIDVSDCQYDPDISGHGDGIIYPIVNQINFVATGDVTTATYNIRQYVMPSGNELNNPGGTFDCHNLTPMDSIYTHHRKNIYVSGNRDWRVFKDGCWFYDEDTTVRYYTYIGYRNLERPLFLRTDQYCIRNDGLLYYTKHATSDTSVACSTGSKTFTVNQTGLPIVVGNRCRAWHNATNYMEGTVTSYSGTTLVVNIDTVLAGSGTYDYWFLSHFSTKVYSMDTGSTDINPTETEVFDLADLGLNIKSIRGLCIDEDEGWLWIATNVGFVKADIFTEYSGGVRNLPYITPVDFYFYNHTTPGFALYMTAVANVTIWDAWNGRFQAERGTLTWTQASDPKIVWHWTGDRDARTITVTSYGIFNLFVEYDLGMIVVVRNSNYNGYAYSGASLATVIRIGSALEGLVSTFVSTLDIRNSSDYSGYGCGVAQKKFWFVSANGGGSLSGIKGYIDLTNPIANTILFSTYKPVEQGDTSSSTTPITTWFNAYSCNRSIHPDVITYFTDTTTYGATVKTVLDVGPIYCGWDGAQWVKGDTNASHTKTTHFASEEIPGNIFIGFNDGGVTDSFKSGDYYSFGVNPKGLYLDNLQTASIYISMYGFHSNVVTDTDASPNTITVPVGGVYTIPEVAAHPITFVYMAAWAGDPHVRVIFADGSYGSIINPGSAWASGVSYTVGTRVVSGGINYRCILAHTSSSGNQPPNLTYWTTSIPATPSQVLFEYPGRITFDVSHVGENVRVRYAWLTRIVE